MNSLVDKYAQLAYTAYREGSRGKTYRDVPTWDELSARARNAWRKTALTVVHAHEKDGRPVLPSEED